MIKTHVDITIDAHAKEHFDRVKGNYKLSHLMNFWLNQFLDNKKGFTPKGKPMHKNNHLNNGKKRGVYNV